jgi:spoIIIJ-associated protein
MDNQSPTPAAADSATPARPNVIVDAREVLQTMLDGLGLHTKVEQHQLDGTTLLHIATVEPGRLIGKHGLTLNQLQFLLNRILQRMSAEAPHVIVDCERYRERQRDDLLRQIVEAGDKVRRWGDPVTIGPYNSFDRRIIHGHLERDHELEAVSKDGDESGAKRITIRLRQAPPPATEQSEAQP